MAFAEPAGAVHCSPSELIVAAATWSIVAHAMAAVPGHARPLALVPCFGPQLMS